MPFSADLFNFSCPVHVRWSDMDAFQHVNNARFLTYFEEGRVRYLNDVVRWTPESLGIIVARAEIDFKAPLTLRDKPIVYVRCSRLGRRRFDLDYLLTEVREDSHEPRVFAQGTTVMVMFDYARHTSVPVPDAVVSAFRQFEATPILDS